MKQFYFAVMGAVLTLAATHVQAQDVAVNLPALTIPEKLKSAVPGL